MATVKQDISLVLKKKVAEKFPRPKVVAAGRAMGEAMRKQILNDNIKGLGINGPMKSPYTDRYVKQKQKYIRSGKIGRKSKAKTVYAAKKVGDKLRLTGQTANDFVVRKVVPAERDFVGCTITLGFKSKRSEAVAAGNRKAGYDGWGMAKQGTAHGRQQRKVGFEAFSKALGVKGNGGSFGVT
jgi:hypothetical protein